MTEPIRIGGYQWTPKPLGAAKGQRIAMLWQRREDRLSLCAAALALSYVHRGGDFPTWGEASAYGSIVEYGDQVFDHLTARGATATDVFRLGTPVVVAGMEAFNAVSALPTETEVDAARDFSSAPAAGSAPATA